MGTQNVNNEVKSIIDEFITGIANRWEFGCDNYDTHSHLIMDIPDVSGGISVQMLIDELKSRT